MSARKVHLDSVRRKVLHASSPAIAFRLDLHPPGSYQSAKLLADGIDLGVDAVRDEPQRLARHPVRAADVAFERHLRGAIPSVEENPSVVRRNLAGAGGNLDRGAKFHPPAVLGVAQAASRQTPRWRAVR